MIIIGGLTGVLSGLMGVVGAFILIPFLVAIGFEMGSVAALSLLYVIFTAGSGTVRHLRSKFTHRYRPCSLATFLATQQLIV